MTECGSCRKQKNQVFAKKSDIIKGVTVLVCQTCLDNNFEPRWAIVLGGRSHGFESVKQYIVKRKYVGPEITANELIS